MEAEAFLMIEKNKEVSVHEYSKLGRKSMREESRE